MIDRRSLLAAGTAAALVPRLAVAQADLPKTHRVAVGGRELFVVSDGWNAQADVTRGAVVNAAPEQVMAALQAAGMTGPGMANPYNVTVLRTPQGLVMLDAGTGGAGGPQTGALLANMRAAGLGPADVTLILHTHFHGDHIGGLQAADGSQVYPNARILVPEREWSFWNDPAEESRATEVRRPGFANVRRRFAPYQGKISTFAPGAEVAPGVAAVPTPGHSPGHTSFLISDGNAQVLILGDCVLAPALFVANPEWIPGFDMDAQTALGTRRRILDRAAADRIPVVGYHFPMPATGRVERAGSGYRLVPATA